MYSTFVQCTEPPPKATLLDTRHLSTMATFCVPMDGPHIHSYFNLSTMATFCVPTDGPYIHSYSLYNGRDFFRTATAIKLVPAAKINLARRIVNR